MIKILAITNQTASAWWRIDQIFKYLGEEFLCKSIGVKELNTEQDFELADIVILQCAVSPHMVDICHKHGCKVVYETDDIQDEYHESHPSYAEYNETKEDHDKKFYETMRKADWVTVSTKFLKDRWKHIHKDITVLPNYIDPTLYPEYSKNNTDIIRIGWAGGISHYGDLEIIKKPLNYVLKKYPNTKFIYFGLGRIGYGNEIEKATKGDDYFKEIPRNRREPVWGVNFTDYPHTFTSLQYDIAIAPLLNHDFNKGKSNLKWLEYSWNGVPGIYSPPVYGDYIEHGKTGFIAKTQDAWVVYLSELIENAHLRRFIGSTAKKYVKENYDITRYIYKWRELYKSLVNEPKSK